LISGTSFRSNKVSVYQNGRRISESSLSNTWWTNSFTDLSTNPSVNTASMIYVGSGMILNDGINILADKVALMTERPNGVIRWDNAASGNNCNPSTGGTGSAAKCMIHGANRNFVWIEVDMNGDGFPGNTNNGFVAINIAGLKFSRIVNSDIRNSWDPTYGYGLYLFSSSWGNLIQNVVIGYHNRGGIYLAGTAIKNVFSQVKLDSNGDGATLKALDIATTANDNIFSQVLLTSNKNGGLNALSQGSVYSHFTVVNNSGDGVTQSNNYSSFNQFVVANNTNRGFQLTSSPANSRYSNVVVAHNSNQEVNIVAAGSNSLWHGPVVLPSPSSVCVPSTPTAYGLNSSCGKTGFSYGSNVDQVTDINASTFIDKVTSSDALNSDDSGGVASYVSISDWFQFENFFRHWGNYDNINPFPNPAGTQTGICASGTCQIWDWSIAAGGTLTNYNGTLIDGSTCPDSISGPVNAQISETYTASGVYFLSNAVEILNDSLGNDDTLCNSNEACIFSPHFGAYIGHGQINRSCHFVDSTITGVTMYGYEFTSR
jgi:hypothetical protein